MASLAPDAEPKPVVPYLWRSFDRQWTFDDPRLAKTESPSLWQAHSGKQIFLMAPAAQPVGAGPALIVLTDVPDFHAFRGSYGGKDVLPLYRDPDGARPNITAGLLDRLGEQHGSEAPRPEALVSYVYALLTTPTFQQRFAVPLADKVIRVPLTRVPELWSEAVKLGEQLVLAAHVRRAVRRTPARNSRRSASA